MVRVSSQAQCPGTVQFDLSQLGTHGSTKGRLFTSESSNHSVLMSFAVYLDLSRLSMPLSQSLSGKHTKSSSCTVILTSSFEL